MRWIYVYTWRRQLSSSTLSSAEVSPKRVFSQRSAIRVPVYGLIYLDRRPSFLAKRPAVSDLRKNLYVFWQDRPRDVVLVTFCWCRNCDVSWHWWLSLWIITSSHVHPHFDNLLFDLFSVIFDTYSNIFSLLLHIHKTVWSIIAKCRLLLWILL